MKVSLRWLSEFISASPEIEEVQNALINLGLEIDSVVDTAKAFEGVVLARVLSFVPHPNADKLRLVQVDTGTETLQIVCGASNFKEGNLVALATVGALLPNGLKIKKSKIRGETSFGMLCSEEELGLASQSEGIITLESTLGLGSPIAKALNLDDTVLNIEITPNRGDCLSIIGIAREVAVGLNIGYKGVEGLTDGLKMKGNLGFDVICSEKVKRYTLALVEDLRIEDSIPLYGSRIALSGLSNVNNMVDITNYVMLERGQPMHAFDADKVVGRIKVRMAEPDETLRCLDGQTRKLRAEDIIISDEEGPIALAGIMGGERTAVGSDTTRVLFESGHFDASCIRSSSKYHHLSTDSSYRFERSVNIDHVISALNRACDIAQKAYSGRLVQQDEFNAYKKKTEKMLLKGENIQRILGCDIPQAGDYLSRLGFTIEKHENTWFVEKTNRRPDVEREIDLIEEVARVHGYQAFDLKLPFLHQHPGPGYVEQVRYQIEDTARNWGFSEAYNYSFTSEKYASIAIDAAEERKILELSNPVSSDLSHLRSSLLPGLLLNAQFNFNRQAKKVQLFEVGTVFEDAPGEKSEFKESNYHAFLWAGLKYDAVWYQKETYADFFDMKGFLENIFPASVWQEVIFSPLKQSSFFHPGRSAQISWQGQALGVVGELHPRLQREFDFACPVVVSELNPSYLRILQVPTGKVSEPLTQPFVERDFAIVLEKNISAQQVIQHLWGLKSPLLHSAQIFDRFESEDIGQQKYSLGLRLRFVSPAKTLTDKEVDKFTAKIISSIQATFDAKLR